jgi:hypothetical protein
MDCISLWDQEDYSGAGLRALTSAATALRIYHAWCRASTPTQQASSSAADDSQGVSPAADHLLVLQVALKESFELRFGHSPYLGVFDLTTLE